jgi:hypothetical protein
MVFIGTSSSEQVHLDAVSILFSLVLYGLEYSLSMRVLPVTFPYHCFAVLG